MYLNIILTLLFVVLFVLSVAFVLNLGFTIRFGKYQLSEHEEQKQYNKEVNDEVLQLHWRLVEEVERANKAHAEILEEVKRIRGQ